MSGVEGESSMVKSKSIWEQVSITDNGEFFINKSYMEKKKTKKQQQQQKNTIPEEIIFYILVRVPVELLHKKFRYVCKQWNSIISSPFLIDQSMLHSKPTYIVQDHLLLNSGILNIKDDEIEWSCFPSPRDLLRDEIPPVIMCSCDGLLLVTSTIYYSWEAAELAVINPITKQEVILPPGSCSHESIGCSCGIAFANSTGEYKVVHVFNDFHGCEIFTLGCPENTWRRVHGPFNDPYEKPLGDDFRWIDDPILVNRSMLHWIADSRTHIFSMDINDEKLRKTNLPIHGYKDGRIFAEIIGMNGFLALLIRSKTVLDVWILKDFEKQIWIKQHSIVPEQMKYMNPVGRMPGLDHLSVVAADGSVILFVFFMKHSGSNFDLFKYEMESRTLTKLNKMKVKRKDAFVPHLNTLTRFKALVKSDAKCESCDLDKEQVEDEEAFQW